MKSLRSILFSLSIIPTVCFAADPDFEERHGVVAIEAESTASRLGRWKKKQDVSDYSGECHLEFTGNKPESGPPESPLKYSFRINKAGNYQLSLRARKRLESKRADISNDCYVSMKGDFEAGGGAPLKVLRDDTKMYGGNPDSWGWASQLDFSGKKSPAIYTFKAGETYELKISGRSKNFNLDRILLVHEDKDLRKIQRDNPAETLSKAAPTASKLPTRTFRKLTNKEGRTAEGELLAKHDDIVVMLIRGKRFEISISSLTEEDQAFVRAWDPE